MKKHTPFKEALKPLRIVATIALSAIVVATASAQSSDQQGYNQVAIQLGAWQLGYIKAGVPASPGFLTTQQLANALVQGNQALLAKTTNSYPTNTGYVVGASNLPAAQSSGFQDMLYQCTLFAINNPITYTNAISPINVVLTNPVTGTTTTNTVTTLGLNPQETVPTAIIGLADARVPNLSAGLVSNAVSSSMRYKTDTNGVAYPIFGAPPASNSVAAATNPQLVYALNQQTRQTQINHAQNVVASAMAQTLSTYTNGTLQWAGVPASGPLTNTQYLPNYSTNPVPSTGAGDNYQAPNLTGLANAASAIAANAINGLGAFNVTTNQNTLSLYGKTAANVQALTKQLIASAATFQATSTSSVTIGKVTYSGYANQGSIGASAFGIMTQVSGVNNSTWTNASNYPLVNAVVAGAYVASPVNVPAIALGVAEGFYITYLKTVVGTPITESAFNMLNNSLIVNSFVAAGASSTQLYNGGTIGNWLKNGFTDLSNKYSTGNYSGIAGASGVNMTTNSFGLLNGVGTPVTDTLGL